MLATVKLVSANAAGCTGEISLRVAVAPELAPVLSEAGSDWAATKPHIGGVCVVLTVNPVTPAMMAQQLTAAAGKPVDVGPGAPSTPSPDPNAADLPAVWIPDSTAWLARVQAVDSAAFHADARSIASSPVVMAMPESDARRFGWPEARLQIATIKPLLAQRDQWRFGVADPRRETAGLAFAMLFNEAFANNDADLPGLVRTFRSLAVTPTSDELLGSLGATSNAGPVAEQAVVRPRAATSGQSIVAVQIDPAAPMLDYPFAIRSTLPRATVQAAQLLRTELLGAAATRRLASHGFRDSHGKVGPGFPATAATTAEPAVGTPIDDPVRVRRALEVWTAATAPSRTIVLFDTSASMARWIGTGDDAMSRSAVMFAAAQTGLNLFTPVSEVGMWTFNTGHKELVASDRLSASHKRLFAERAAKTNQARSDRSDLYDTLLDAYQRVRDGYDPSRLNLVVAFTDGGDSSPSEVRRAKFLQDLQRLADPTRPIRMILIGIDTDEAGGRELQQIADAAGGGYFPLTNPADIQMIFLKALLRIGAV